MKLGDSHGSWFSKLDEKRAPNVKQYLRGLQQFNRLKHLVKRPYNFHLAWGGVCFAYCLSKWVKHTLQLEIDRREQPNLLVPKAVYRIRRQHYVFWEISRVARGLPKTFTYSEWDSRAQMMYHVDLQGNQLFEKLNFREERIDFVTNPLLGPLFRRKE